MNILFVHQNFPGQFKHLAPALASAGHRVVALGVNPIRVPLAGVQHMLYELRAQAGVIANKAPPALKELYSKIARGESAANAMLQLAAQGFVPDVVYAHSGWGEALYVKDVFPKARLLIYAEYFYGAPGGDADFDPEFSQPTCDARQRTTIKNTHLLHALNAADAVLSPTEFQRNQHPFWSQGRIRVIHDGIDTDRFRPDTSASIMFGSNAKVMRHSDEVITFVARNLEPYRGYHTFMRALPALLRLRPNAHVVIVGTDGLSYGSAPPGKISWKEIFLGEVSDQLDSQRVRFVGALPHKTLTQLLQVSAAHVYLTYPFVLSWSLMEAMSIGALIIGSRTAPVQELIEHGKNGLLTDFFDAQQLAETVAEALANRPLATSLSKNARKTIVDKYDLRRHCLPAQLNFVTQAA